MTVEEKMSQMLYQSPAIERLGIPAYNWWNGALHGVARAGVATMFPQAIGLAATFDRELIQEIGDVVFTEGRAKFNEFSRRGDHGIYKGLTFWAPNVNIFRDPRWGRGHETYGEDPYLTGELGCAYIKGLQGPDPEHPKVAACAKHFAVHSGPEALRHQFNAQVSKHDLYDTYLYAFKRCVKDAKVEAVMGAYNRVNGEPACGSKGLQNGLEKISKILMSALLIMIVVLAVHSFTLSGAGEGIRFYLIPNLKTVKEVGFGNVVSAAMNQAFFTLSLGVAAMEIFGSYLKKGRRITGEAINVVILDTFVAVMAGLIIIPACFAYGVQPDAGPSLLFITLPNVFQHMVGGRIWGCCFFVFMSFAALSTVIAVFENIITMTVELGSWTRKKSLLVNLVLIFVLSLPAILGFNLLSGFQPFGDGSSVMDLEDFLVSYNILPLGSLIYVLFCVRKNGWGWEKFLAEVNEGTGTKLPAWLRGYMAYVVPTLICLIYLKGYYDMFAGKGTGVLLGWMAFAVLLLAVIFWVCFSTGKKPAVKAEAEIE